MSWDVVQRGSLWRVVKSGTDEVVPGGCHDSAGTARAQQRALYANEDALAAAAEASLAVVAASFSAEQREELAKSGVAMEDGSFPIRNTTDLKNAIQAFGRAKDQAAAKAHIIKRAEALGATELLPESWSSDSVSAAAGTAEAMSDDVGFQAPVAAGVALVAVDTGRVLMIQRARIDGDPSGGRWEFPGGKLDDGETTWMGASREFAEETGHPLPEGEIRSTWLSTNGVYQGFVYAAMSEDDFQLNLDHEDRVVMDPDNPDGSNYTEAMAWWDVDLLTGGAKFIREEVRATPWRLIKEVGAMTASAECSCGGHAASSQSLDSMSAAALSHSPETLVAAVSAPASAFLPSEALAGPTPFTVRDDNTVDGHIALWASCHTGLPGCVRPPKEQSFDFFNLGEAVTADGRRVPVGKITVGGGHAGPELSWRTAASHYDETGTATAVVHAVPDKWGIRTPGVIIADASPEQVDELRRSPISGDWRRINGQLRLVAALAVNVPGYPVPRALVASSEAESLIASINWDAEHAAAAQAKSVADQLAQELGLDLTSRANALAASIR